MDDLNMEIKIGLIVLCIVALILVLIIRSLIMIASITGGAEAVILLMFIVTILTCMYVCTY